MFSANHILLPLILEDQMKKGSAKIGKTRQVKLLINANVKIKMLCLEEMSGRMKAMGL